MTETPNNTIFDTNKRLVLTEEDVRRIVMEIMIEHIKAPEPEGHGVKLEETR